MNNTNIELKEESINYPSIHPTAIAFTKKKKKRLLSDMFYPRWELELLLSFAAIILLGILPEWVNSTNDLLSSKYGIEINTDWINITGDFLMAGFILNIILRLTWFRIVWTEKKTKSPSLSKQHLAMVMDELAEIVFFAGAIISFMMLLGYFIQVLGVLLHYSIAGKMKNVIQSGQ